MKESQSQNELHPHFPSGEWEGFFTYSFGKSASQHKMQFHLDFQNGHISGRGVDNVGAFRWKGSYDCTAGNCTMTKFYIGKHLVEYEGCADENGIWGTWIIFPDMKGGFHIWPKGKNGKEEQKEVIEVEMVLSKVLKKDG